MTARRGRFSPADRVRIVLESFKSATSNASLCREHGIDVRTLYMWRERFVEGGSKGLSGAARGGEEARLRRENEELKKVAGELAVANALFKKALGGDAG